MLNKEEIIMKLGYIGLGKMGFNMVELLLDKKYEVVTYNKSEEPIRKIAKRGAQPAGSLKEIVSALIPPRLIWIMVPYEAVDPVLKELVPLLAKGDVVVDGGNSPYKESIRRAKELETRGIDFLDVGVSGGPTGARNGACIMVGGRKEVFQKFETVFRDLSVPDGYGYMGRTGAGHFVKMVHNGIEYGMMAAYGEGFELLAGSKFDLDLHQIAGLWRRGSVVRSWLLDLAELAFERNPRLASIEGYVADSGEGRWTVQEALDQDVPLPIITLSLMRRFASRQPSSFSAKVQAALRNEFGGHAVKSADAPPS
jgi:6-phosphogluconate dehydrogenase